MDGQLKYASDRSKMLKFIDHGDDEMESSVMAEVIRWDLCLCHVVNLQRGFINKIHLSVHYCQILTFRTIFGNLI